MEIAFYDKKYCLVVCVIINYSCLKGFDLTLQSIENRIKVASSHHFSHFQVPGVLDQLDKSNTFSTFTQFSVPGGYSEWTQWSGCSKTCGNAYKKRERSCSNPPPKYGGSTCIDQGFGPAEETVSCNLNPCPSKYKFEMK